jgi:hypothetical protein
MTISLFVNLNVFAQKAEICWNKKVFNESEASFDYRQISEAEYNDLVVITAQFEDFRWDHWDDVLIFKLYYDADKCVLTKLVNHLLLISIEYKITALVHDLDLMQPDDALYYRCSFEFPSGEIFESDPIKVSFALKNYFKVSTKENIHENSDYERIYILKSDDDEYYQEMNLRTDSVIENEGQFPWGNRWMIKFNNILPGKKYSYIRVLEDGTQQIEFESIPFSFLVNYF